MSGVMFEPLIAPSLWMALATASIALLIWYALRRPAVVRRARWAMIITLMSCAVVLVLAILLNPIRVTELPPPAGKPALTVLVDVSGSMATPDVENGMSRYDAAQRQVARIVDQI